MNNMYRIRNKIAKNYNKIMTVEFSEPKDKLFLAPWEENRISWEDSQIMSYLYYHDIDKYYDILERICEGTGHYIELYNHVEGLIFPN